MNARFWLRKSFPTCRHDAHPGRVPFGPGPCLSTSDGISNGLTTAEKTVPTLHATRDGDVYAGPIGLRVRVG